MKSRGLGPVNAAARPLDGPARNRRPQPSPPSAPGPACHPPTPGCPRALRAGHCDVAHNLPEVLLDPGPPSSLCGPRGPSPGRSRTAAARSRAWATAGPARATGCSLVAPRNLIELLSWLSAVLGSRPRPHGAAGFSGARARAPRSRRLQLPCGRARRARHDARFFSAAERRIANAEARSEGVLASRPSREERKQICCEMPAGSRICASAGQKFLSNAGSACWTHRKATLLHGRVLAPVPGRHARCRPAAGDSPAGAE